MAEENDSEVDSAMMEAMGFAQFGAQAAHKRKFDGDNAIVDMSTKPPVNPASGANNTILPSQSMTMRSAVAKNASEPQQTSFAPPLQSTTKQPESGAKLLSRPPGDPEALQALQNGVRNANGDMVYFLPSFVEDPWEHLEAK